VTTKLVNATINNLMKDCDIILQTAKDIAKEVRATTATLHRTSFIYLPIGIPIILLNKNNRHKSCKIKIIITVIYAISGGSPIINAPHTIGRTSIPNPPTII
jgi:hypothetical protein